MTANNYREIRPRADHTTANTDILNLGVLGLVSLWLLQPAAPQPLRGTGTQIATAGVQLTSATVSSAITSGAIALSTGWIPVIGATEEDRTASLLWANTRQAQT